jgi:hypothetical protein
MLRPLTTLGVLLAVGLPAPQGATVTKAHADSMAKKIAVIQRQGSERAPSGAKRRTPVSEAELNSWFAFQGLPLLPTGLTEPKLRIVDNRTVVGDGVVDLDVVAKSRATGGGGFDIWNLIGGRVPVTVTGFISARGGKGRFELQSAQVAGVPVSPRVVQLLLGYYSRSASHPDGLRLDQEYELPSGIREIELSPGTAVVVQ